MHRASVTQLCAKDYNAEQIAAWTSKHSTNAGKQRWADKIRDDLVWVLENEGTICMSGIGVESFSMEKRMTFDGWNGKL